MICSSSDGCLSQYTFVHLSSFTIPLISMLRSIEGFRDGGSKRTSQTRQGPELPSHVNSQVGPRPSKCTVLSGQQQRPERARTTLTLNGRLLPPERTVHFYSCLRDRALNMEMIYTTWSTTLVAFKPRNGILTQKGYLTIKQNEQPGTIHHLFLSTTRLDTPVFLRALLSPRTSALSLATSSSRLCTLAPSSAQPGQLFFAQAQG